MEIDPNSVLAGLLSNVVWFIAAGILLFSKKILVFLTVKFKLGLFSKQVLVTTVLLISFIFSLLYSHPVSLEIYIRLAIFCIILLICIYIIQRHVLEIGIVDAHKRSIDGIDFDRSLRMCRESISFLGIGAHKLTTSKEFEQAIKRTAQSGTSARFLLCDPESDLLEKLAKRNNDNAESYRKNVIDSLSTLNSLRDNGYNIEIRHYNSAFELDHRLFRALIIDDNIVLLSWTIWDSSLGKNNPQMILRRFRGDRGKITLAKAFMDHFERLWESSKIL